VKGTEHILSPVYLNMAHEEASKLTWRMFNDRFI